MKALVGVSCLIAALTVLPQIGAHPSTKKLEPKVNVTVVTILASDRCKCIDPRLKDIAVEVQKADPNLKGFSLVSMTQKALPADEVCKFACIEDTYIEVVVRQCIDKENKVSLAVTPPQQNEIVYRSVCGKFFPIVTRYQAKEQVPPMWVAKALGEAMGGGPVTGQMLAFNTLLEARTRARLIIAIRAQPCLVK